jgi:hypothetical protein
MPNNSKNRGTTEPTEVTDNSFIELGRFADQAGSESVIGSPLFLLRCFRWFQYVLQT